MGHITVPLSLEPVEVLEAMALRLEVSHPERAMEFWSAAIKLRPDAGLYSFRAGKLAMKLGWYKEAVDSLAASLETAPDHVPTKFALAQSFACLGENETARVLLLEIARQQPSWEGWPNLFLRVLVSAVWAEEAMAFYRANESRLCSKFDKAALRALEKAGDLSDESIFTEGGGMAEEAPLGHRLLGCNRREDSRRAERPVNKTE